MREQLRQEHQLTTTLSADADDDEKQHHKMNTTVGEKRSIYCCSTSNEAKATGPKMKQHKLMFYKKLNNFELYANQFEINKDFAMWATLDLQPFFFTTDRGTKYFVEKIFSHIELSSRYTVSRMGLNDVYDAPMQKLKKELRDIRGTGMCVMFDGWTDKYKKLPYMGLRIGYVSKGWENKIITVSCKVLEKHSANSIADHIKQEIKLIGVDTKRVQLFSAHDGAANMMKTSKLLNLSEIQHCLAHSLHLLLMADGIGKSHEITELLERCKTALSKLLFKSCLMQDEITNTADREFMNVVFDKITDVQNELQADHRISLSLSDEGEIGDKADAGKRHETLKQPVVMRWNSLLNMIVSILYLWYEMSESFEKNWRKGILLI